LALQIPIAMGQIKPKYKASDSSFFKELRMEVKLALKDKPKHLLVLHLKAIVLVVSFLLCMAVYIGYADQWTIALPAAVAMGLLSLPMVLNIGHEAVHGTFSKNKRLNRLAKWVFQLLGTSAYFWELRHISSHHHFGNVAEWDLDIEQSKIIRLSKWQKHEGHHKHQHLYMPIAFCFYTLIWFFLRDFKDLERRQFGSKKVEQHPRTELIKMGIAKLFHISTLLLLPYAISGSLGLTLLTFFSYHISASIVTTFALVSTHVGERQQIVEPDARGQLPHSWAEHQLMTTADFATKNRLLTHYFGGFNHHVAHHLFPNVPHIHYPIVTRLIKKHAKKNALPYHVYPNLFATSISHLRRLKTLSVEPEI